MRPGDVSHAVYESTVWQTSATGDQGERTTPWGYVMIYVWNPTMNPRPGLPEGFLEFIYEGRKYRRWLPVRPPSKPYTNIGLSRMAKRFAREVVEHVRPQDKRNPPGPLRTMRRRRGQPEERGHV